MKVLARTATALAVAAAVVAILCKAGYEVVRPALIVLIALAHLEFSQLVARRFPIMAWQGVAAGAAFLVSQFYFYDSAFPLLFFALAVAALFLRRGSMLESFAFTSLGLVYLPMMLAYLLRIAQLHPPAGAGPSLFWLLYVVSLVKISDMGGFAFGLGSAKVFGRNHKMCPNISPNKSWEGMVGSVFGSCLVSCLLSGMTGFGFGRSIFMGVCAAVFGTLGDLVESGIKRECGAKDSATFMPAGMGGFLDMFDSLVFAPAILYSLILGVG